jgi:ethanolaminephosphotransferase
MELLLQAAKQVLKLLKATFPGYEFNGDVSSKVCDNSADADISRLECEWQKTWKLVHRARKHNDGFQEAESSLISFSRAARDIMSSTASKYNLTRLYVGAGLTGLCVITAVASSFRTISTSGIVGIFFVFILLSYCIMMFGTSYVEEEQEFWYWVLSGWILYLHIKSYVIGPARLCPGSNSSQGQ